MRRRPGTKGRARRFLSGLALARPLGGTFLARRRGPAGLLDEEVLRLFALFHLLDHPPRTGAAAGPGLASGSAVFWGDLSTLHRTTFPTTPANSGAAVIAAAAKPGKLLLQIISLFTQYPSDVVAHFQKGIDGHRSKTLRPLGHFGLLLQKVRSFKPVRRKGKARKGGILSGCLSNGGARLAPQPAGESTAASMPMHCATMNAMTPAGAMPANVSDSDARNGHGGIGERRRGGEPIGGRDVEPDRVRHRRRRARRRSRKSSTAGRTLATASASHCPEPVRAVVENCHTGSSNIRCAIHTPMTPPMICAAM